MSAGATAVTVILTLILIFLIAYIVYRVYRLVMGGPKHIDNYFKANFKTVITEWDLVTRPRLKEWKSGMGKKLKTVGKEIGELESHRNKIDKRMAKVERDISGMEAL